MYRYIELQDCIMIVLIKPKIGITKHQMMTVSKNVKTKANLINIDKHRLYEHQVKKER